MRVGTKGSVFPGALEETVTLRTSGDFDESVCVGGGGGCAGTRGNVMNNS